MDKKRFGNRNPFLKKRRPINPPARVVPDNNRQENSWINSAYEKQLKLIMWNTYFQRLLMRANKNHHFWNLSFFLSKVWRCRMCENRVWDSDLKKKRIVSHTPFSYIRQCYTFDSDISDFWKMAIFVRSHKQPLKIYTQKLIFGDWNSKLSLSHWFWVINATKSGGDLIENGLKVLSH